MTLYSLLLGAVLVAAAPSQVVNEIIYKVDSTGAPASEDRISFIEERRLVAGYLGESPVTDAMNPKSFHDYSQVLTDDMVVLGFDGISVPYDIAAGKKWQEGSNSCSADPITSDGKRLLVVCGPRSRQSTTTSVYTYEKGRGITGFFAPCFIDKTCWFELQSGKGLLATLPPLAP